jgi:hypothetical protein
MRILVAGWFSFERMGATAGDLLSKDVVCDWLDKADLAYDVALDKPFTGGINWKSADPSLYTHVIFVCGPFGNGEPLIEFMNRFAESRLIGINLSLLEDLKDWDPFDFLFERDSSRASHPDLSFLSPDIKMPVVGLILAEPQSEYGKNAKQREANEMIYRLLYRQQCAIIPVDTRLDIPNQGGLRTPGEIEAVISKMDMVVTTRLHGLVLSIKNGVPVLAIDSIAGGAKVSRQANSIGWPNIFIINQFDESELLMGYQYCLTEEARRQVKLSKEIASDKLKGLDQKLTGFLKEP